MKLLKTKLLHIKLISFVEALFVFSSLSILVNCALNYIDCGFTLSFKTLSSALLIALHLFSSCLLTREHISVKSWITLWRDLVKHPSQLIYPAILRVITYLGLLLTLFGESWRYLLLLIFSFSYTINDLYSRKLDARIHSEQLLFSHSFLSLAYHTIRYEFSISTSIVLHFGMIYCFAHSPPSNEENSPYIPAFTKAISLTLLRLALNILDEYLKQEIYAKQA